jgi:hypothetical protein
MRRFGLAVVACACLMFAATGLRASEAMKGIVDSYLEIHARLATDKIDGIKAPASAIVEKANSLGAAGAPISQAAKAVADAPDLKTAREAFGGLSDAVIAAAKAEGWKDLGDIKVAFCPMVKRSWMQKEDKVRNPYYGTSMLECGELKKP